MAADFDEAVSDERMFREEISGGYPNEHFVVDAVSPSSAAHAFGCLSI